eukprot:TRINITY_DN3174_c3_g1_i1.p1 TRINITY_DN3174_c3_g1~~TRINITY_DN3174_c3_g1_i1.p1  ORF type:complete len:179 (+),score=43.30 TRINITY_DN3174_c3_g1_i1:26-538(+)
MEAPRKVYLVGEEKVGKTALARALAQTGEPFPEQYKTTVGPPRTLTVASDSSIVIMDCAGQLRHRATTLSALKEATGVLLVIDLSRAESFKETVDQEWARHLTTALGGSLSKVLLLGNKSDLAASSDQRQVSDEEARAFVAKHNMLGYLEVSAKTQSGLVEALATIKQAL